MIIQYDLVKGILPKHAYSRLHAVASLKFKKEILRNNAKLRDVSDPAWVNSVFITPDLTPKQQEKDKALRARLSELNATSKIYKIKNGEIVRRENQ